MRRHVASPRPLRRLERRFRATAFRASPRVVDLGEPVPKGGGTYRVGSPYVVGGRTYVPSENPHYAAVGLASWYGEDFHGRYTANGEIYDLNAISAAHPTMPIPSYARVTNLNNGRSLVVRVNDRGPFAANRIIDVSVRAAKLLDFYDRGTTRVRVEYLGRAPMQGSNDRILRATLRENQPAPDPEHPHACRYRRPRFPAGAAACSAHGHLGKRCGEVSVARFAPGARDVVCRSRRSSRCGRHRPVPQWPRALLSRTASSK